MSCNMEWRYAAVLYLVSSLLWHRWQYHVKQVRPSYSLFILHFPYASNKVGIYCTMEVEALHVVALDFKNLKFKNIWIYIICRVLGHGIVRYIKIYPQANIFGYHVGPLLVWGILLVCSEDFNQRAKRGKEIFEN